MKRSIIMAAAAVLLSSAAAMAAPFSDVPSSHWAMDAVNKLAGRGILLGFPDGSFKGNKGLTRFDMAMVTAKMLAHVEQMFESGIGTNLVTKADLQTLEKLTTEFADELALLGVKITALEDDMKAVKEDTAFLKKDVEGIKDYIAKGGMEKVKLSGDMLVRHSNITHKHDVMNPPVGLGPRPGNSDNSLTESMIGLNFTANIDENISAVVYWAMLDYHSTGVDAGQSLYQSAFGVGGIGGAKTTDNTVYLAYLEVKDMFRFGGDFTFGRNLYAHNHSLLLNNYLDAVRYSKPIGNVNLTMQTIYDRHQGSYKDDAAVDFRGVWNLDLNTTWKSHEMYLGLYGQDEPDLVGKRGIDLAGVAPFVDRSGIGGVQSLGNTVAGQQSSDKRWDVEFGSKGPIGGNDHWSYDLGFVYTNYELDVHNTVADTTLNTAWISPEMQGWMGHGAIKWDSKKQWAAKLAYTFADDESVGAISILNDMRYQDAPETPYEDIGRGNTWFDSGLRNMFDLKLQAEYRPVNSKHYFRLAGDFLDEMNDTVTNDMTRHLCGEGRIGQAVSPVKTNLAYDNWNSFGVAEAEATVITFEYRYQLAENTRLRVGYTTFDLLGDAVKKTNTVNAVSAGRGINGDYDYHLFWTEVYSRF
ncbi:MAG TPA: S-layer homology domain-containing protein [Candidatus Rifleibacterium sp.]|nr:S-layer homology domain-containing protein [Candidatus Rifleibacterium sp.]